MYEFRCCQFCHGSAKLNAAMAPESVYFRAVNFSRSCAKKCIWIPDNLPKTNEIDYGMLKILYLFIVDYHIHLHYRMCRMYKYFMPNI